MIKHITIGLATAMMLHASLAFSQENSHRRIALRSTYLSEPVEGFRRITVTGDLRNAKGHGHIELDPNRCELNPFGDPGGCTEIAPTSRSVIFSRTRTSDPAGLNRQLWVIAGAPLKGVLFLVVPESSSEPHRLVHEDRNGDRTVIAMEPLDYQAHSENPPTKQGKEHECDDLAREVDGVQAEAQLRPGIVNDTYFLFLYGRKPHANTWVRIEPVVYTRQPEYWQINVNECHTGDILLPAVMPYVFDEEVTKAMGTKGIELRWANGETLRVEKP